MLAISVYTSVKYFTNSHLSGVLFGIFAAICGNSIDLISSQYIPQFLGISCLLLAFTALLDLMYNREKQNAMLCGMIISGVFATYCEFTVYLFIVAIILLSGLFIKRDINVVRIVMAILSTIAFNIYGFYKAVDFNIRLLSSVMQGGIRVIDFSESRLFSGWEKIGHLAGLTSKPYLQIQDFTYKLLAIVWVVMAILCIVIPLLMKEYKTLLFISATFVVVLLLEVYFVHSRAGYEEYKHLTSSCYIAIMNVAILFGIMLERKKGKFRNIISMVSVAVMIVLSIRLPLEAYVDLPIVLDSKTMELQTAATLIPDNRAIAIDNTIPIGEYMGVAYALRFRALDLEDGAYSYLQMFQQFGSNNESRYRIYPREQELKIVSDNNKVIWCNEKYILVENTELPDIKRLRITGTKWYHELPADVYKESDFLVNTDDRGGYVLYGPYTKVADGVYNIFLQYTVQESSGETGYFEVFDSGEVIAVSNLEGVGCHEIVLDNIIFENNQSVEFRVYANPGSIIKVEGIGYQEVESW
jgi:hypothetical protein